MKRAAWLLPVCLFVLALPLPGAVAVQVDLVSRYIWRGFDLLPGNHPAIQPSLTIDLGEGGLSLNIWSSFALAQRGMLRHSDEIDLALAYTLQLPENWEMTLGLTHYGYWFADGFKFKDNTSQEAVITVARADWPLSPQLSVYYDFNLGSGFYVTLGGSQALEVNEKLSVEMGALIGFNSRQYIEGTGLSDIDLCARAPLALGKLTLTPAVNLMIPLLDEVNEDVEIWFGFSVIF